MLLGKQTAELHDRDWTPFWQHEQGKRFLPEKIMQASHSKLDGMKQGPLLPFDLPISQLFLFRATYHSLPVSVSYHTHLSCLLHWLQYPLLLPAPASRSTSQYHALHLKMKAAESKILSNHNTTWHHNPEDLNLKIQHTSAFKRLLIIALTIIFVIYLCSFFMQQPGSNLEPFDY